MGRFYTKKELSNVILDFDPCTLTLWGVMVEFVELNTESPFLLVKVVDLEQQETVTKWLRINEIKETVEIATQDASKLYRFRITDEIGVCDTKDSIGAHELLKPNVIANIIIHAHKHDIKPYNGNFEHEIRCVQIIKDIY